MLLAVYGTLKKGHGNYRNYLNDKEPLACGKLDGFKMYSMGAFPACCKAKQEDSIMIEIYEVDDATLEKLDRLEGHPRFYKRELVETVQGMVWMYLQPEDQIKHLPTVECGWW